MNGVIMPIKNVSCGKDVKIWCSDLVNLYNCSIDDCTTVGPFVEIQSNVKIGKFCKISSHSFICEGVTIGDGVFIGHGVMFTNDRHPTAVNSDGSLKKSGDWNLELTCIEDRVSIGSGAVILPGIRVGEGAVIGAGAVVVTDIPPNAVVVGNPARIINAMYLGV